MMTPKTPIVVIAARQQPALVEAAKALGAAGFLFKSRPLDEIAANLCEIDAGRPLFPANVAATPDVATARQRIADLSATEARR